MKKGTRFFTTFASEGEPLKSDKKGRSLKLLESRNAKLFHRYYYYSRIIQMRYENVLMALQYEFDLTESTLIQLVAKNAEALTDIGKRKLTRAQLKKMFPHFTWNDKAVEINKDVKQREVYGRY